MSLASLRYAIVEELSRIGKLPPTQRLAETEATLRLLAGLGQASEEVAYEAIIEQFARGDDVTDVAVASGVDTATIIMRVTVGRVRAQAVASQRVLAVQVPSAAADSADLPPDLSS